MKFNDWLNEEAGRLTRIAAEFNITPSAVCQWRESGVPQGRMKAVRDLSGGRISLDEMIPDAEPSPIPAN